nr:putative ribonuclease H-like domain-containing protein [Tanacetum cinerariifolium]
MDHLGKFNGKADEGFFVGYSLNSKAFRVFNSRTKIVKETLHNRFSENTPNKVGTKDNINADQARKEKVHGKDYILQPLWNADPPFPQEPKSSQDVGFNPSNDVRKKVNEVPRQHNECKDQEEKDSVNSTNKVNTVSSTFNDASNEVNVVGRKSSIELPDDPNMPELEDISIFEDSNKDVFGAEVDLNNLESTFQGHIQEEGIDYDEVFAPVARIEAIRLFLAYASFKGFMVYQMDVKSAFLYGKKEEEKFGFSEVKTASTPMETQKPLLKDEDGEEVDVYIYRSLIRSLMYLTSSRPDIMFAVCACARYQVNPKVSHLHAVKRVFRYLKGQPKLGLWYPKDSPFDLMAYTDSDYARASLDRKSTTGGCQFLGCRLISWQCKKQTVVANFTTEAEYVAASSCYGQFWTTAKSKIVNEEVQIHALVDGMKRIGKGFSGKETPLFLTMVGPNQVQMGEERRVNKLEKKHRSRTHKLKRLYKVGLTARVISSSDNEALDKENTSKHGRIDEIDTDEDIALVSTHDAQDNAVKDEGIEDIYKEEVVEEMIYDSRARGNNNNKNNVFITTSGSGQRLIEADYEMEQRLQAEEQGQLTDAKEAKLFMKFLEKRRKFFAAKRVEEKRNKPPTKTQQRSLMWTTQESSSKRAGDELEQQSSKKQKVEDDKESEELKKCLEIIPNDEDDVTIDATPLSIKTLIVDYKIYKEGNKSYFQIFKAG